MRDRERTKEVIDLVRRQQNRTLHTVRYVPRLSLKAACTGMYMYGSGTLMPRVFLRFFSGSVKFLELSSLFSGEQEAGELCIEFV